MLQPGAIGKLPIAKLSMAMDGFLAPVLVPLAEKR
jgi:hypothetical protein